MVICYVDAKTKILVIYKVVSLINLEKEMAIHSSILAWKIPWTEDPGRLQSMGLWRVGHDWATSLIHSSLIKYLGIPINQWFGNLVESNKTKAILLWGTGILSLRERWFLLSNGMDRKPELAEKPLYRPVILSESGKGT